MQADWDGADGAVGREFASTLILVLWDFRMSLLRRSFWATSKTFSGAIRTRAFSLVSETMKKGMLFKFSEL